MWKMGTLLVKERALLEANSSFLSPLVSHCRQLSTLRDPGDLGWQTPLAGSGKRLLCEKRKKKEAYRHSGIIMSRREV
jgi:hypothetical protein